MTTRFRLNVRRSLLCFDLPGHRSCWQLWVNVVLPSHGNPPCCACCKTERVDVIIPVPQVTEQVELVYSPHLQSTVGKRDILAQMLVFFFIIHQISNFYVILEHNLIPGQGRKPQVINLSCAVVGHGYWGSCVRQLLVCRCCPPPPQVLLHGPTFVHSPTVHAIYMKQTTSNK